MPGFDIFLSLDPYLKEEWNIFIVELHKYGTILSIEEDTLVQTWNIASGVLTAKLVYNALIIEQDHDTKKCGLIIFGNILVS